MAVDTVSQTKDPADLQRGQIPTPGGGVAIQVRVMAISAAARFHGAELDGRELRVPENEPPSPAALTEWLQSSGLWAKAVKLSWRQLAGLDLTAPVVLLLNDGRAGLGVAADKKQEAGCRSRSRLGPAEPPMQVDQKTLGAVWGGEAVLMRAKRST